MWTGIGNSTGKQDDGYPANAIDTCVCAMAKDGYTELFKVTAKGLYAISTSRYYRPEQVNILKLLNLKDVFPFESPAIIYVMETSDGLKGTLIDTRDGRSSDDTLHKFVLEVADIRHKIDRYNQHEC